MVRTKLTRSACFCTAALLVALSVQAQTLYSDAWSDDGDILTEGDPANYAYGTGVTSDDNYQYGLVRAHNWLIGVNGETLEESIDEDWYYAQGGFTHHYIAMTPGNNCSSTRHEYYDEEVRRWFLIGATSAIIDWADAHVRWRNLGPTGPDGYYDYGPDNCVTDCIRGHRYYQTNRGTYLHGDGWAVAFWSVYWCHLKLTFAEVQGQCSGPAWH